jgi:CubicO group peptidase (beta-lactamase class C family)
MTGSGTPSVAAPVPMDGTTADAVRRKVAAAQQEWRAPSVVVRVVRRGEVQLDAAAGSADWGPDGLADRPVLAPGPDVQYRMGSITKTFTAALVMQARDDGLLGLDDRLDAHLDVVAHGGLTLRRMLCHLSGLQREPVGDVWAEMIGPDLPELLRGLGDAEAVLDPQQRWHYSNLAFALLGQVVAEVRGKPWAEVLAERLLGPLGLSRTTCHPAAPVAQGYFVDPYADRVRPEPLFPGHAFGPAADLWSTATDLGRWAAFWADPDPAVLAPTTVAEMTHLHAMADLRQWTVGWGLGLSLHRRKERLLVGHGGAMPGFLAAMVVERASGVGVVVLTNTTRVAAPEELALDLADVVLDAAPEPARPWRPGRPVPADVEPMLGQWWSEGVALEVSWRAGEDPDLDRPDGGHLEIAEASCGPSSGPTSRPPSVLRRDGAGRWRGVSGPEQGELLLVSDGGPGVVRQLSWATYPVTRSPLPFGAASEAGGSGGAEGTA